MQILKSGFNAGTNPGWANVETTEDLFRFLPTNLDKWDVLRYFIVDRNKSLEVYTSISKRESSVIDQLLKKHFTKEEIFNFISENEDFVRAVQNGVLDVFVENFGIDSILNLENDKIKNLELEKENVKNGNFLTKRIKQQKKDLIRLFQFAKSNEEIEKLIEIVSPEFLINNVYGNRLTNFPDKLRPFFTNLDYFGYPSNVRYAKIKHWKDAENAQIALDLIPQKEMGKAIDYYLKNKPYLAKSLYNYITNSIIDNYLKPNYSNYPQESKEIVDKVLIHKQKQLETLKNKSLLNNNSKDFDEEVEVKKQKKMVFFKLYNGKKVSSDEDCFMIVKAFLEESLTIESFCNKYKISDVSGFRRMLEYVSSISEEYKNKIDNVIQKNQNKFILSTNDFISKILDPNVDIEELIKSNKSKQRDLKTILSFKIPQKDKEMIILKVMSNFHSRLSLDDKSSNVENINRLLSDKELRFIIGYENFEKLNRGEVVNLDDCINDLIIPYRSSLDKQSDGGFGKQCLSPIKKLVVKYSTRFSGKKYLKSEPGLGDKNGEVVKISPEMVDMAVHYAKVNKLYLSHYTIEKILKAIIDGEINNYDEMSAAKQNLKDDVLKTLKECESIEEYLKSIDSSVKL